MSDVIMVDGRIFIDTADIEDVRGLEYQGKPEDELAGSFVVRIFFKKSFIDIVCSSLTEAKNVYRNIQKSRHIVNINELRYGK